MAERFENLDNISRDGQKIKDKEQTSLVEAFEQVRKAGRRKIRPLLL